MVENPPAQVVSLYEAKVGSLGLEDSPDKEMATRCSILHWEIPGTEECHGLQSMGFQKSRI